MGIDEQSHMDNVPLEGCPMSVVMPAHNASSFVEGTLRSVAAMEPAPAEVIIVDDGSTDDTHSVVTEFIRPRGAGWRVLRQPQAGVSAARNRGLVAAVGEYVLFLDADDLVDRRLAAELRECLAASPERQPDIVCWRFQQVDVQGKPLPTFDGAFADDLPALSSGVETLARVLRDRTQKIWTGSAAYRREFLAEKDLRFTEGCARGEDVEFIWKSLALAERVAWIDDLLSFYVSRAGSVSAQFRVARFDGVRARQRAARFLSAAESGRVADLGDLLQRRVVPQFVQAVGDFAREDVSAGDIFREIDRRHPGLTREIRSEILRLAVSGTRVSPRWLLMAFAPTLYIRSLRRR